MARAGTDPDPVDRLPDLDLDLDDALARLEDTTRQVAAVGEPTARQTRRFYDRLTDLMDRYEEPATGTGEFQEYVAFQDALAALESDLENADVTDPDAFQHALDRFERRIIREKDFRRARADLEAVKEVAGAVERAEQLETRLANERGRLTSRLRDLRHERSRLTDRIADLEAVTDVDPEPLVSAREAYNDRVREDFERFVGQAAAIEVARIGRKAQLFPLSDVPPIRNEGALDVLVESGLGEESVPTVLEYAGYSDSKLQHYVDRPRTLRNNLPVTWFETIDGDAFTIGSDVSGDVVRHRAPALMKVIEPFAESETVAQLRRLRDLAVTGAYERMRRARRLADDDAPTDVADARAELDAVEAAIDRVEHAIERIDAAPSLDDS